MIGSLSYEDMAKLATGLMNSAQNIREVVGKYNSDKLNRVLEFCDAIESYARFLNSSVQLYHDSDEALKTMIEKNK